MLSTWSKKFTAFDCSGAFVTNVYFRVEKWRPVTCNETDWAVYEGPLSLTHTGMYLLDDFEINC